MMQAIRGRAGGIIVKVLFGLLILSFGFWGIYTRSDYFQGGRSPETVVATVGDQDIRADEVQQALQPALERLRAQFGAAIDPSQVKQLGIVDTLLNQLIDKSLVDQEAHRLGLEASDEVVRSAIYDNPAFRGQDGKFDRQLFGQILAMNHITEDQLVAKLRQDVPRADLLQAITTGVSAPRPVIDALYKYRNEKRVADIVAIPVTTIKDVGQPSDADLQKFYEGHPDLFRAPEYRGFVLASLSPNDLKTGGDIPDDKLRAEYEQRKDELATPETRDIQQILLPSEEKAKEAEGLLAAGKDFKEVATSIGTQDPDTIDLGELNQSEIPKVLGDVAFQLALDKPSDPVKSPLGWHVLRVTKINPGKTASFEEAKPKIEAALKLQDAVDQLDKIGNQADDALAGGGQLADVAAKFGLKITTVAEADENGNGPDGKPVTLPVAASEVMKTVFATNQGETSRLTDMQDGAIFAVHIDKVLAPTVRPLADVKDTAIAGWQAEQKRDAAAKQAEDVAAAAKTGGTLSKIAGDKGMTLLSAISLSRSPSPGQVVPPALVAKIFDTKQADIVSTTDASGGYVAQLKDIQIPDKVPDEAAAGLTDQMANQSRVDAAGEFTDALRHRYTVTIKHDALDKLF
ncbi:MAG: SurA N-terminal domain-containing protein [Alphaproteobacteria bacterium]|nr:SurA N-terminal domain-containing protein [Alphaproteobacteria bacterium]